MLKFLGVFREELAAQSDCTQPRVQNRLQNTRVMAEVTAFSHFWVYKATTSTWVFKNFSTRGGEALHRMPMNLLSKDTKQLKLQLTVNFSSNSLGVSRASHMFTSIRTSELM